jgi:hypothetical protein
MMVDRRNDGKAGMKFPIRIRTPFIKYIREPPGRAAAFVLQGATPAEARHD